MSTITPKVFFVTAEKQLLHLAFKRRDAVAFFTTYQKMNPSQTLTIHQSIARIDVEGVLACPFASTSSTATVTDS